jgi:predicted metalloprotease with PDZ domain
VAYGLGAERQAKLWFDGKTATVVPVPLAEEPGAPLVSKVQASYANFVWGLPPSTDPLYPSVGITTPEAKSGERYKVIMVAKESPAEAAGFKVGDEIVSLDGVAITDKETSNRLMSQKRWGDAVVYKVMRDGQEVTLTAHLRRQPPKAKASAASGGAQ